VFSLGYSSLMIPTTTAIAGTLLFPSPRTVYHRVFLLLTYSFSPSLLLSVPPFVHPSLVWFARAIKLPPRSCSMPSSSSSSSSSPCPSLVLSSCFSRSAWHS